MANNDIMDNINTNKIGRKIYALIEELFPICRSITGNGLRETLDIVQRVISLEIHHVPSGTEVFDWTIPKEWNIRDAYIKDPNGDIVVNFAKSNLHIVNYSVPIHTKMPLNELRTHLFSLPERPDWVPYRTSYYKEDWGFCLSHNQLSSLPNGIYEVLIDSTLEDGYLSYGECYIPGQSKDEFLISTHICHPSLANDNLSGIALSVILAEYLSSLSLRYSYRIIFIPGTIGAITWLFVNQNSLGLIRNGLVICGIGDCGEITYKRSRRGNAEIDRAVEQAFRDTGKREAVLDFDPYGYDERQYCSPGINLPVGRISRTPYSQYPEYHTSADNLDFINSNYLEDSFNFIKRIIFMLEKNHSFINLFSKCEPQLGRRGLYDSLSDQTMAMLWILNLSDGNNSLLDIASRSGTQFDYILKAASILTDKGLLKKIK